MTDIPQRFGDWNARNRELLEETHRRGGNPYAEKYRKLMTCQPNNFTPDYNGDGRHCANCGRPAEQHVEEKFFDWDPGITDHDFTPDPVYDEPVE